MQTFNRIPQLKKYVSQIIKSLPDDQFPVSVYYCEGLGDPKYKISFEVVEEDFFVDSKGQKWMKVKDEDN